MQDFDIAIIGGGINGCGIAANAALRGLSVILLEKGDLASATSSKSTNLIHGGLRYLEQYDFKLVKKALDERGRLQQIAPHLVHPLKLCIPYQPQMRSPWLIRAGLFVYDHLSFKNKLPRSRSLNRRKNPSYFNPLAQHYQQGFLFYDCWTDDARLTLANAQQAAAHGAVICPYTALVDATATDGGWQVAVQPRKQPSFLIRTRVIINAAGPWVNQINTLMGVHEDKPLSLVKGSHLILNSFYPGDQAYLIQHPDKRVIFVIPYHEDYVLIGTTDCFFSGDLDKVEADQQEITYLLDCVNQYFDRHFSPKDILTTISGVRPLLAQDNTLPQALSRDYAYIKHADPGPAVSVYGGKITTYRQLAAEVIDSIQTFFPDRPFTKPRSQPLPGSDFEADLDWPGFCQKTRQDYGWLPEAVLNRYLKTYGSRLKTILLDCQSIADLQTHFGHGLYQREVDYLLRSEWVNDAADLLWRRTKLGLVLSAEETQRLQAYIDVSLRAT